MVGQGPAEELFHHVENIAVSTDDAQLAAKPPRRETRSEIHGWSALGGLTMAEWEDELEQWLKPFLDRLGHKTRQRMCPLYVAGLIGPGDRKSVQPMAERVASGNYDQLHHFIADGVWDATPLESELLNQADRLVGGKDAVLVIDDTAMPKKDTLVSVADSEARP